MLPSVDTPLSWVFMPAIEVADVSYRYPQRQALSEIGLTVNEGEVFAFLGPNGGGKTTLFRLLATLMPLQEGTIRLAGFDARTQAHQIRRRIGVVFQAPSLDKKLTVAENLKYQGWLYGLAGQPLRQRAQQMLEQLGVADRAGDRVETLSGGLRRRVELAKACLHGPSLLLMDEPSTGLDPAARIDLWRYLRRLRERQGVTIVLTTHLLEEAEKADRLAILAQGRLVAVDTPDNLRAEVGGDAITVTTSDAAALAAAIEEQFALRATVFGDTLRLHEESGHVWIPRLVDAFPNEIRTISVGKPTLEDVFIARTGHRFWEDESAT